MERFGYQLVNIIGNGTFGTVYRCIDANNNNIECCIKRIKLIQTTNVLASKHFDMIQQEIYLLQNLIHPRIIHLYDYFYSNDNAFVHIVMELAAFGPLSKMIADRRSRMEFFQELKIQSMLIDMVLGIEYLHMKNVVHKDIKPCNILICDNGRLKIADFGVSKITEIDDDDYDNNNNRFGGSNAIERRRKTKEAGGSPIYMAPETLIYNEYSFASDIWALGCILYELCMLRAAFDSAESYDELIRCTLTKDYIPIKSCTHPYSEQLIGLCDIMMDTDKQRRATINDIVCNPSIVIDYYRSYFDY